MKKVYQTPHTSVLTLATEAMLANSGNERQTLQIANDSYADQQYESLTREQQFDVWE